MAYFQKPRKTHLLHLITLLLNLLILQNRAQDTTIITDPSYYYNLCAPSTCNNLSLPYPFTLPSFCHPSSFQPSCPTNQSLLLTSPRSTDTFRVLPSNFTTDPATTTFFVASNFLFSCGPISKPIYTSDAAVFSLPVTYTPGTHLNCTTSIPTSSIQGLQSASCLGCPGQDPTNVCYYAPGFVTYANCEAFHMYSPRGFNVSAEKDLRSYLQRGFQLRYNKPLDCRGCETSGGRCGSSPSGSYVCFCSSSVHTLNCSDGLIEDIRTWARGAGGGRKSGLSKAAIAGVSASASIVFLALLAAVVTFIVLRRKPKIDLKTETISNISPTRYSYSQIKKFTNNFSEKLGEGGYGSVYKGVIHRNGVDIQVAVKILKSKQSEKQFMNEVATVGSVHHHHLVGLLGYSAQGERRALVYEFMEKGSLDKYIYKISKEGGEAKPNSERLSFKQMYNIALETARGILYLHQGCRSTILHCDIKPHNVLLDSNLTAKVADFGLAKMMDKDHSHVSLTGARGTPGYAAPEMWLKTYGPVTEKSDVYGYGMLLLEMIGGRKNYDPEANESSQVYFPEWAFDRLKSGELPLLMGRQDGLSIEIVEGIERDQRDEGEGDEEVVERMCLVGLWCIQHIPSNRPSMDKVIQMLEGNAEIGIPPHPFPQKTNKNVENYSDDSPFYLSVASGSGSIEAR